MIFFSLRILILRLRNETLNTLFKSMWPSILFLLEKMIRSSKWDKTKNHEIVIAAMKLLELISFTDIEEFNLHRWAFLFEYFGIKIIQNKQNLNQNIESPFIINPALICKIPQGTKISYQGEKSNKILKSSKRKILLIRNQLHSERMEEKIVEFLNYWILLSTTEMKINQKDMESLIQGDFIDFKNFINL